MGRPTGPSLNGSLILSFVRDLADADADIPPPAIVGQDLLTLLPALLLLLAGLLGGLRTLLQSPVRSRLLGPLGDGIDDRVEALVARRPSLATACGLARLIAIVAAIGLTFDHLQGLATVDRWVRGVGYTLFGGIVLEAFPALVQRARARRVVLALVPLARLLAVPLLPLTWLVDRVLHLFGADGDPETEAITADIVDMVHDHEREEELRDSEKKLIGRVIELDDADAARAMTPRTELTAVSADASLEAAVGLALEEGHSRLPVYGKDLDDLLGVFYLKDAVARRQEGMDLAASPVRTQMRDCYFVPETKEVLDLLEEMRQRRVHLAVVIDEYGGTAGVVTIEDLVEEIVGEIQDEHDEKEEQAEMLRLDAGTIEADGRVGIDDLNEFFPCHLPDDEDFDTVAGLLFDRFGHIPAVGEQLELDGMRFEVLAADDRRILRVRMARLESDPAAASDEHAA